MGKGGSGCAGVGEAAGTKGESEEAFGDIPDDPDGDAGEHVASRG
jgi:hypothetical protein